MTPKELQEAQRLLARLKRHELLRAQMRTPEHAGMVRIAISAALEDPRAPGIATVVPLDLVSDILDTDTRHIRSQLAELGVETED